MTERWTEQHVYGAILTLMHVIELARLTCREADKLTGLVLPKFDVFTFRSIVRAMDPYEGLIPLRCH